MLCVMAFCRLLKRKSEKDRDSSCCVWRWQVSFVSSDDFLERAYSKDTMKSKALRRESYKKGTY